jgi:VWFA-related protein
MKRKYMARPSIPIFLLLLMPFASGIPCHAQSPNIALPVPANQTPSPAPGDANRMSIDVQVTDTLGHNVTGLTAADFSLLDNKQPAKILDVRQIDTRNVTPDPVHIVIVVDTINTGFDVVAREREQLGEFLTKDDGRLEHPTTLALLSESGLKIEKTATLDGNVLFASLTNSKSELRLVGRSAGFWGATDRLQWSLEQLGQLAEYETTVSGRKFLFLLSPGWPMLPWSGMDATEKQERQIFRGVETFSNDLRAAHIVLYALDPYHLGQSNPFYYQTYLKPISNVNQATYPDLALQVLAAHSGGLVEVNGMDVLGELNTVLRDTALYYTVAFEAPPPDRNDELHALRLTVNKPGATVRTTAGYFANTQH